MTTCPYHAERGHEAELASAFRYHYPTPASWFASPFLNGLINASFKASVTDEDGHIRPDVLADGLRLPAEMPGHKVYIGETIYRWPPRKVTWGKPVRLPTPKFEEYLAELEASDEDDRNAR